MVQAGVGAAGRSAAFTTELSMRALGFALSLCTLACLGGCSDPIPPTAKGGMLVNFQDTGATCPNKSHKGVVGTITGTELTTMIVDGQKVGNSTADITCRVSGAFSVSGSLLLGTDGIQINVPAITATATKDSPAKGSVSFFSFDTAGNTYASSDCDFYFVSGTPQGIKAGEVFMAFSCAKVLNEMSDCAIAESYVSLGSCDQ